MLHRASINGLGRLPRSMGRGSVLAILLLAGAAPSAMSAAMPGAMDDASARPGSAPAEPGLAAPELTEAEQTAQAYRAVFDRLPRDLEAIEQVPSGRGLDSWKLFVDHPELVPLAEALVAIAERASCDFALIEELEPSVEHHPAYNRAKNLLLHRVVTKLHGDRMQQPDDFGNMPEPVGVDPDAARRYGVAMLNMAVHFSERGTLAERRIAANAAPDLMGVARRAPQGLPWAMETLRASRYLEPLQNLFGYQAAAIARFELLSGTIEADPDRYIKAFGLTPADGNMATPLFAATLERHRWAYSHAAETLRASWDLENPLPEALAMLRAIPRDLAVPRASINEITRAVSELAAARQDVRVMLEAYPAASDQPPAAPEADAPVNDDEHAGTKPRERDPEGDDPADGDAGDAAPE